MNTNPFLRSYTKIQLRHLVIDPNYDLKKLEQPIKPDDIKPMGRQQFINNVKLLIDKKKVNMKWEDFVSKRFTRQTLPACWCRDILTHMIGT